MEIICIGVGVAAFIGGYFTKTIAKTCCCRDKGEATDAVLLPDTIASGNAPEAIQDVGVTQEQQLVQSAVNTTDIAQFKIYINNLHLSDINQLRDLQLSAKDSDFNVKL